MPDTPHDVTASPARHLPSLRGQLSLVLGGLALAILTLVGVYLGRVATQELYTAQQAVVRTTAQFAADLLATELRDREREIELLSVAPHLVDGPLDAPRVRDALERRAALHDEFGWLGVAAPDGTVLQATGGLLAGRSVAQREWFIAARERVYVGDVHEAKLLASMLPVAPNGEPTRFIDFAAPIRAADGKLLGVVGAHAHWRWVTGLVEGVTRRQNPGGGIDALILDRDGRVLYPEALKAAQADGANVLPRPASGRFDGELDFGGQTYLTSEAQLQSSTDAALGWRIVTRQPLEQALRPVRDLQRELVLLGIMAAAVLTLAALLLARRISRPVEELAQIAERVEAERRMPDFPPDPGAMELARLSDAMRAMAGSLLATEQELQQANATLEAQVQQRTAELQAANAALEHLATRDPLTGLHNRRSLDARLAEAQALDRRYGRQRARVHALLLLDVDHFKRINDQFGHPTGDAVLRQLAHLLQASIRATDVAARFGGEEFAVLLPELAGPQEAVIAAEKIRAAVETVSFAQVGRVTVSVGVSLASVDDLDARPLIDRADGALYEAKRGGRNAVVLKLAPTLG
ncbi:diguanylate cyclase [Roseateles cellulosilyticus]|uniref:diguanylate cyclase n=1 Tax=Pelomonas cellulosilytica TaxID=2906762 RepID=A0ABS8XYP2_9BURK|nr:sensor domain-containing diguanylate cyclase [Pelomonas sp. P8]MCE4556390.1 diguanylate cyclase [Pelomonas sp. P8]